MQNTKSGKEGWDTRNAPPPFFKGFELFTNIVMYGTLNNCIFSQHKKSVF